MLNKGIRTLRKSTNEPLEVLKISTLTYFFSAAFKISRKISSQLLSGNLKLSSTWHRQIALLFFDRLIK